MVQLVELLPHGAGHLGSILTVHAVFLVFVRCPMWISSGRSGFIPHPKYVRVRKLIGFCEITPNM